ncbi:response regulator transcription factor [Roseomonas sp. SSH11]|uniref:Response regulator transcription factor n=1 Tax=Pararoseomonas baculiformis TaxID=2820812 RepID=A0ABS4AE22_9PROT|nr:response regulator transcription factor [Pararoseomonas baculiformis]
MTPAIRVVVADDHPIVLAGIRALLLTLPEVELVGEATSGSEALNVIRSAGPDVAVVDLSMPGMNGLELTRQLTAECPTVRVLALTVHEDRAYVGPMLAAGARGYLLKRSAAEDLPRAVRAVAAGGLYLDPAVAEKAMPAALADARSAPDEAALSVRELEVLRLTAQGFSNKEIAGQLALSVKTAETYKARGAEKLGLRTRAEIVRFGAARGWLDETGNG